MPTATLWPSALALTVKSDSGSLPAPRLWNGPPKLSVIGPFSMLDPDGSIVSVRSRLPLVTVCVPVKVCLSSVLGLAEPLLAPPHAAVAATVSIASMSMTTLLNAVFR